MTSPGSFVDGIIAAFAGIFISVCLFFAICLPGEQIVAAFETMDVFDLPEQWLSYSNTMFWMNLMYVVTVLPALIGLITLFLSSLKTQQYDVTTEQQQEISNSADEMVYMRGMK
jgi:nitrogen fixation-related uncharacterized protein